MAASPGAKAEGASAPSAKCRQDWACRSMSCATGKAAFRSFARCSARVTAAIIGPTMSRWCADPSLLSTEGYTVRGVQQLLKSKEPLPEPVPQDEGLVDALKRVRAELTAALAD